MKEKVQLTGEFFAKYLDLLHEEVDNVLKKKVREAGRKNLTSDEKEKHLTADNYRIDRKLRISEQAATLKKMIERKYVDKGNLHSEAIELEGLEIKEEERNLFMEAVDKIAIALKKDNSGS